MTRIKNLPGYIFNLNKHRWMKVETHHLDKTSNVFLNSNNELSVNIDLDGGVYSLSYKEILTQYKDQINYIVFKTPRIFAEKKQQIYFYPSNVEGERWRLGNKGDNNIVSQQQLNAIPKNPIRVEFKQDFIDQLNSEYDRYVEEQRTPHFVGDENIEKGQKKKECTAVIIENNKGEILLLQRSGQDDFHPKTWCLPGGGVDPGEDPTTGVIRETKEEVHLNIGEGSCYPILTQVVSLPEINIYYYYCDYTDQEVVLDSKEHQNYKWCSSSEWMDMDLILDLKQHLIDIYCDNDESSFPFIKKKSLDIIKGQMEDLNQRIKHIQTSISEMNQDSDIETLSSLIKRKKVVEGNFIKVNQISDEHIDLINPELLPDVRLITGLSTIDYIEKGIKDNTNLRKVKVQYRNKKGKIINAYRYISRDEDIESYHQKEKEETFSQFNKKKDLIDKITSSDIPVSEKIVKLFDLNLTSTQIAKQLNKPEKFVKQTLKDKGVKEITDGIQTAGDKFKFQLKFVYQELGNSGLLMYCLHKGLDPMFYPDKTVSKTGFINNIVWKIRSHFEGGVLSKYLTGKVDKTTISDLSQYLPDWNDVKQKTLDLVLDGSLDSELPVYNPDKILKSIQGIISKYEAGAFGLGMAKELIYQQCRTKDPIDMSKFFRFDFGYAIPINSLNKKKKESEGEGEDDSEESDSIGGRVIWEKHLLDDDKESQDKITRDKKRLSIHYGEDSREDSKNLFKSKLDFFSQFTDRRIVRDLIDLTQSQIKGEVEDKIPVAIIFNKTRNHRASYSEWSNTVNIQLDEDKKTIAHELGHMLENNSDFLKKKIRGFYKSRVVDKKQQHIPGCDKDEVYKDGGFVEPYVGKVYKSGATEILSMWFTLMADNPIDFIKKDPEHFKVCLEALNSDW